MKKVDKEKFIEIFDTVESDLSNIDGDNCFLGLQIISKYVNNVVCGASHDQVYSSDLDELISAGITEEDVIQLAKLNWSIEDEDYLYCFV